MPWCPGCKAEYQEGYTVCSDCKLDLVEDIKEAEILVSFFQSDNKKIAEKLVKFFNYSDLNSSMEYDKENDLYIVSIPPNKQMQAKKLYQAFYFVERERMDQGDSDLLEEADTDADNEGTNSEEDLAELQSYDDNDNLYTESEDTSEEEYSDETPSDEVTAFDEETNSASVYVMKADQYKDLTGTVWVFLVFGIGGSLIVLLNVIGVFHFFNGWIADSVMGALFLIFIYVAISTNAKAKKVKGEIEIENKLTIDINEWLKVNVTTDFLATIHDDSISEEYNYLKITDTIKEILVKEFGNQNLAYLDRLIEEFYNENF